MSPPSITPVDWKALWQAAYWSAREPLPGVCLPEVEAQACARAAFDQLRADHPVLPSPATIRDALVRSARERAKQMTATRRVELGDLALWHDENRQPGLPAVSLADLRAGAGPGADAAWLALRAWLWRHADFSRAPWLGDREDIFQQALAGLTRARDTDGLRPLDAPLLVEEVPALFAAILQRRIADHWRSQSAEKREAAATISLEDPAAAGAGITWSAPPETLWQTIEAECRHLLSELQWEALLRIYVDQTANQKDLLADPAVAAALGLRASDSYATRWRRLTSAIGHALDSLRSCIQEKGLLG